MSNLIKALTYNPVTKAINAMLAGGKQVVLNQNTGEIRHATGTVAVSTNTYGSAGQTTITKGKWLVIANGMYSVGSGTTVTGADWNINVGGVSGSTLGYDYNVTQKDSTSENFPAAMLTKIVEVNSDTSVSLDMRATFSGGSGVNIYGHVTAIRLPKIVE